MLNRKGRMNRADTVLSAQLRADDAMTCSVDASKLLADFDQEVYDFIGDMERGRVSAHGGLLFFRCNTSVNIIYESDCCDNGGNGRNVFC